MDPTIQGSSVNFEHAPSDILPEGVFLHTASSKHLHPFRGSQKTHFVQASRPLAIESSAWYWGAQGRDKGARCKEICQELLATSMHIQLFSPVKQVLLLCTAVSVTHAVVWPGLLCEEASCWSRELGLPRKARRCHGEGFAESVHGMHVPEQLEGCNALLSCTALGGSSILGSP